MLKLLWRRLAQQEELIAELDRKIEEQTRPFEAEIDRLDAVPGVDRRVAEVVLAEVGPDMKAFPTHENLASWAGMCPGNEESAGKRVRKRITPGNRWLKRTLAQATRSGAFDPGDLLSHGRRATARTVTWPRSTVAWPAAAARNALSSAGNRKRQAKDDTERRLRFLRLADRDPERASKIPTFD